MSIPEHILVRFDLVAGRGDELDPAPGRIFIVGPQHTFEDLGDAVNQAFGRWDLSPSFVFELSDGRVVALEADSDELVAETTNVMTLLRRGDRFGYVFDLGDAWRHDCEVLEEDAEPDDDEETFEVPPIPVPVWGWGMLPDQYGRAAADDDEQAADSS
jgi:hypothetical protein